MSDIIIPDTSITDYKLLPEELRRGGGYDYLVNDLPEYWRHAVDVAHDLLDNFAKRNATATYFQTDFRADFIAALQRTDIEYDAPYLGPFVVNRGLSKEEREINPDWIEYRAGVEKLRSAPRGAVLVYQNVYSGGHHWEASAHCGGGYISDCSTMEKGKVAATHQAIINNILSYEGYLARKQAEKEREILGNYAVIEALNLRPGTKLQEVELNYDCKLRRIRFVVDHIHANGMVSLIEGAMRGSSKVFTATINASKLTHENLLIQKPVKRKQAVPDESSLVLF